MVVKKLSQINIPEWLPENIFLLILADMAFYKNENQELYFESIPALQEKPELIILSALSNFSYYINRTRHFHMKNMVNDRIEFLAKMVFKERARNNLVNF